MTLHLYFIRRFLVILTGLVLALGAFLLLLDLVETLRRFDARQIGLGDALGLAALALPEALYRILPLVVILAALVLFLGLARTSELVVTRAAGRPALRTLMGPVGAALAVGVAAVGLLNPIVAATMQAHEARSATLSARGGQVASVSREGLWLRQGGSEGQTVIRAARSNLDGTVLSHVTFLAYAPAEAPDAGPVKRIDAREARLEPGAWALSGAKVWPLDAANPEAAAQVHDTLLLPTTLTRAQIRDSFATPAAIPIWSLPGYIETLSAAGFSARLHRVWFQMELATPLFLAAMVLSGAAFTLRHTRFGRTGTMVMAALGLGFGLYFIRNFAQILGESGQIPVWLAAWAPPVAGVLIPLGLLLHLEDG